ncbi:hypothetical protein [Streptomyces uncialis]|uniref:hypothetical protein n=1 Tax=Streptomyces uncialis TaxID=1048205 RepID=UPI0038682248|nr:hypothetical protein OG268_13630 [Streptomyces uncialis]
MSRLLDSYETEVSPSYRIFGLVDTSVDTYSPHTDRANWILSAPGMVYLQVPPQVIRASVRLESWSTTPPEDDAQWCGTADVEVQLPGGELALETIDGGQTQVPLALPSPGLYGMRWHWILNHQRGPFTSPLADQRSALLMVPGREEELRGADQYCLVRIWRIEASEEAE